MRRQMQLRPSQGGKMRGPTNAERQRVLDGRVEQVKAALALLEPDGEPTHEGNSLYSRFRNDHTCRCGYVLCACVPTETVEPEPLRYAAKPSIEVGMRVRVRDDAPHECRGKTGTYRARETCGPEGVWHLVEFDGAFIHPLVRSLDHLEPIK